MAAERRYSIKGAVFTACCKWRDFSTTIASQRGRDALLTSALIAGAHF